MSTLDDILMHYGMPRRSGRYPWGSGDNPYQHSGDFLSRVEELRGQNFTFTDPETGQIYTGDIAIAKSMGMNSTQFRAQYSIAKNERRRDQVEKARSMREDGHTLQEIADSLGLKGESTVRSLLSEGSENKMNLGMKTADFLKKQVDEKGMIDVGAGTEFALGVKETKLKEALEILKAQGYEVYGGGVPQATNPGKQTTLKILCPPGTQHKEIYNFENIHNIGDEFTSHDGGETFDPKWVYPASLDSKRLQVRYSEEGGNDKDGVIELRRGVPDISLGESRYSQVRVLVDGTHYLKGMAVYSDDMPDGVDVIFNTNKHVGTPVKDVLKPISNDPENPFGSLIKEGINDPDKEGDKKGGQSYYIDANGNKKLSLINKRADEGDWGEWAKKLPAQFLAKQNKELAKKQLNLDISDKEDDYNDILSVNNPTVKRTLLESFAGDCDSAAVHLKAAALPRNKYQVILPLTTIKDNEIYAPNFNDGENVALIRFPHGYTGEIPILRVNNKNKEGQNVIGKNPKDAVGITKKVADQLSGADFDGDTVLVIPANNHGGKVHISTQEPYKGLKNFDTKSYQDEPGTFKLLSEKQKQREMGKVSNLITDMTIKGAPSEDIEKAVKHSMVVIDAVKHKLNYQRSERENDIPLLTKKWKTYIDENGKESSGASTLISRASGETHVPKRKGDPYINLKGKPWYDPKKPEGSLIYKTAPDSELYYTDRKTGKRIMRTQSSTQMADVDDARKLSSGLPIEEIYADYANKMKAMANRARIEMVKTGRLEYKPSANKVYKQEVNSLDAKLNTALKNQPLERRAQLIANSVISAKKKADPNLTKEEKKKISQRALISARTKVGAKRHPIDITDKEWEAIQAGAISDNKLTRILKYADIDILRQRATPKTTTQLSPAKIARIKSYANSGYSNADIAKQLGISASTVSKYL